MDDDELRQIREARLSELRGRSGGASGAGDAGGAAGARDKEAEMRASVLPQLLTQDARERLNRVRIVRPERATQVEQVLMRMAQSGQLRGRLDEPQLVALLDQISRNEGSSSKLVFRRRTDESAVPAAPEAPSAKAAGSDDDDDFFD